MSTRERALQISTVIHSGQTRWDGTDYINHPKAVEELYVFLFGESDEGRCVSLLHDTVEDHPDKISFDDLIKEGFTKNTVDTVRLLTRDKNVPYLEYLKNIKERTYSPAAHSFAQCVKIADLTHNLSCFPEDKRHGSMYDKYCLALFILEQFLRSEQIRRDS